MELAQLRGLVTLAEELHFGRAAARLRISQSALSQQLHRLEDEFEVTLVARTSREITLTGVGEVFLSSAQRVVGAADRGIETINEFKAGGLSRLVIGCLSAGANGPLPQMIAAFRSQSPGHVVELRHFADSASQERNLLAGYLDLIVVRSVANDRALVAHQLFEEPFVVYLPECHRLASHSSLTLTELAGEPFILWPREIAPSFYDRVIDACRAAGFTPHFEGYGTTLEAQLALVAAGVGITLQAASNQSIERHGVNAIPLESDGPTASLWLAYRRRHHNPVLDVFLQSAPHAVGTHSQDK
jgi:DNA-binding transcriptional LysR family regulator